jgi:hypothetical protein
MDQTGTSREERLLSLPKLPKKKSWTKGSIVPVEKGKACPISGIALTEPRAKSVARFRIKCDELDRAADVNRRYCLKVIGIYKKNLAAADAEILRLRQKQGSWYQQNKVAVWVSVTVVLMGGLFGLSLWGLDKIRNDNQ